MKKISDEPAKKLDIISDIWMHFFWEYEFGRKYINFHRESTTKYFGDILSYFHDTLQHLERKNDSKDYQGNTLFFTGILQIIYVQQDLIGELLHVFAIDKDQLLANDQNRNINRNLRNELIGHPIRRDLKANNALVSSTIFGNRLSSDVIHYVRYAKDNNFRGVEIREELEKVIDRHVKFLNRFLDLILQKLRTILDRFRKRVVDFEKLVTNDRISFKSKLTVTHHEFQSIFKESFLYEDTILLKIYERRAEHPRYQFAMDLFFKELTDHIRWRLEWLDKVFTPKVWDQNIEIPEFKIVVVKKGSRKTFARKRKDYHYEMGKLFEKHPIWGVSWFKKEFAKRKDVMLELNNMETKTSSKLEYYSSYEYLRHLLGEKYSPMV